MPNFRKKPVLVEAMQWDGTSDSLKKIAYWANKFKDTDSEPYIDWVEGEKGTPEDVLVHTLEGECTVTPGDWIVKGTQGDFYREKDPIFKEFFEPVED